MSQNENKFLQIIALFGILAVIWALPAKSPGTQADYASIIPFEVEIAVPWKDLGKQMIDAGVIDAQKFENIYSKSGGLNEEAKSLLYGTNNGQIKITGQNAHVVLNLLWAFGLSQKNSILENGPMMDPKYGGADRFASTGGWSLAQGQTVDHYSKHEFVTLTGKQQKLVEEVSKNIYRPCCDNPVHFPDCNHGMAMLGLLELLAANNFSESKMYEIALEVNALWFPDTYKTIAKYFDLKGQDWKDVEPKEILGPNYSSYTGYSKILKEVPPDPSQGGASCGV